MLRVCHTDSWPLYGVREEVAYKDASHLNSVSQSEKDVSKYIFTRQGLEKDKERLKQDLVKKNKVKASVLKKGY